MLKKTYSIITLELPFGLKHFRPIEDVNLRYLDVLELGQSFAPYYKSIIFYKEILKKLQKLNDDIRDEFNVNVDIIRIVKKSLIKYQYSYSRILRMVESINPRIIPFLWIRF